MIDLDLCANSEVIRLLFVEERRIILLTWNVTDFRLPPANKDLEVHYPVSQNT